MTDPQLITLKNLIQDAQRIMVVSHIRPDGDAIGSVLAMGLALKLLGKEVQMTLQDGVPSSYKFLSGSETIQTQNRSDYDLSIVVDCSDLIRTGSIFPNNYVPDVNIDHHPTNISFANLNVVRSEQVSTTAILAEIFDSLEIKLTPEIASALLTGLITDTIGFRTPNMTPDTLRLAARLFEAGAHLPEIYKQALVRRSLQAARLWGIGLSALKKQGNILWTELTLADKELIGYSGRDDADLVNILTTIDSVDIAVIFVEQPRERVKISWRSTPGFDVSMIAYQFGGGGHANAAGAEITGDLENVKSDVLQATFDLHGNTLIEKMDQVAVQQTF